MKQNRWYRIIMIIIMALGILIRIVWYRKRRKTELEQELLWRRIGIQFKKKIYELEGLLIKIGQVLSVRADLLPASFIEEMKELVDQVPPSPWEEIQIQLETEWECPYYKRLASLESYPVASASIGEVYKGALSDGTPVAIKVQRPNIRRIIEADFQALAIVMWFIKIFSPSTRRFINFTQLYREIRQVVDRELDFRQEMQTAIAFKKQFENYDFVCIPATFPEYCTGKVLVMEWVDTFPILQPPIETDHKELAQNLLRLFIPQWLKEGTFHADPHTGNVLLNSEGKIVLLDFGMVGDITRRDSEAIQSLIEGIILKNNAKIVQSLSRLGFLLPSADPKNMERLLHETLQIDFKKLKEMDILSLKLEINQLISSLPIQVPTRFVFLGRSFATVQGIIQSLYPDEDLVELGKPVFNEWLERNDKSRWKLILQWVTALPWVKAVQEIPEYIQEPRRLREWKAEEQRRQFQFVRMESAKRYAFIAVLFNGAFAYAGIILHRVLLYQLALSLAGASALWYAWAAVRQRRWMRKIGKN